MGRKLSFSVKRDAFEWEYFRAGGNGGQAQNKSSTGARCRHRPSGAVGEARDSRGQLDNKRAAFRRMAESAKFQSWCRVKALDMPPIDDLVDAMMQPHNIKVEVRINNKWTEV